MTSSRSSQKLGVARSELGHISWFGTNQIILISGSAIITGDVTRFTLSSRGLNQDEQELNTDDQTCSIRVPGSNITGIYDMASGHYIILIGRPLSQIARVLELKYLSICM